MCKSMNDVVYLLKLAEFSVEENDSSDFVKLYFRGSQGPVEVYVSIHEPSNILII